MSANSISIVGCREHDLGAREIRESPGSSKKGLGRIFLEKCVKFHPNKIYRARGRKDVNCVQP